MASSSLLICSKVPIQILPPVQKSDLVEQSEIRSKLDLKVVHWQQVVDTSLSHSRFLVVVLERHFSSIGQKMEIVGYQLLLIAVVHSTLDSCVLSVPITSPSLFLSMMMFLMHSASQR